MTPPDPRAALVLVLEARDLGALGLTDHSGRHRGVTQLVGCRQDGVAVDDQHRGQRHLVAHGSTEALHLDTLPLGDAGLLPTGLDHGIHRGSILPDAGQSLPRRSTSKTRPRPSQTGHRWVNDSSSPSPMRLRVISTRPSSEMSKTWVLVLSRASASRNTLMTCSRLSLISMSMKSMTTMPPMSRNRSWRATSTAASRLLRNTVSSRLDVPTFLPVLTSMTVSASVCSMMSDPPDGNHTLRSSALCNCSCTWNRSKAGSGSSARS